MPVLKAKIANNKERSISFISGQSLLEILNSSENILRSGCGGNSSCGLCQIRIEEGEVHKPSTNEKLQLTKKQIDQGVRLACQVLPKKDMQISIVKPESVSRWKDIPLDDYMEIRYPNIPITANEGKNLGIAVDLGTTHIRLALWDIVKCRRLAGRSGINPQARFGADVMTRLSAASESYERASEISQLAVNAIAEAIRDMICEKNLNIKKIAYVTIVGNTGMLALLARKNYDILLNPGHWMEKIDCRPDDKKYLISAWELDPLAAIEFVQPLGGFVGSDLLAGIAATRMIEGQAGSLLIDFGTNSEIALWDGEAMWVTSAAGGPAFEGCGMSCGMPAESGAISSMKFEKNLAGFVFKVIGGGEPKGLCGSGLVDCIACLLRTGMLKSNGRFTEDTGRKGFVFPGEMRDFSLRKQDIDAFQRAKGSIGAGIKYLLEKAGMTLNDLRRVCVCGAFGKFLNVSNAQTIGLLPEISAQHVDLYGNTAIAGCELFLLDRNRDHSIALLINKCRMINLAQFSEFEDLFIKNLFLRSMDVD